MPGKSHSCCEGGTTDAGAGEVRVEGLERTHVLSLTLEKRGRNVFKSSFFHSVQPGHCWSDSPLGHRAWGGHQCGHLGWCVLSVTLHTGRAGGRCLSPPPTAFPWQLLMGAAERGVPAPGLCCPARPSNGWPRGRDS